MEANAVRITVVVAYFVIVLIIGAIAYRRTAATAEDYFLGSRSARSLVLFMALFGTNITPFVLMGIPGLAYHHGIVVFGHNAAIVVLGIPLTFWLIGYPAWIAAKHTNSLTPAELYAKRFGSRRFGWLMFAVFFVYTVPYMVTAVFGVGLAVDVLSEGQIGFAEAAAGILIITLIYTTLGGMRATMWTNVFQGAVFLGFSLLAFVLIARDLGGVASIMQEVQQRTPALFERSEAPPFQTGAWASWALAIALTVIAFPHMLVRVFAANDATALKNACRFYPLAMVLLWVPAVLFGIWGTVEVPGLIGKDSDRIFPLLVLAHLGPLLQGMALASILAAVMSTLDAQLLTLSSMLCRDVLPSSIDDRMQVRIGQGFLIVIALLTWLIVVQKPASIFTLASLSFSGYVTLVPTLLLGLRWHRFTVEGASASLLLGNAVMLASWLEWLPSLGLLPVAWGLIAASVGALVGSLLSRPTDPAIAAVVLGPVDAALRADSSSP
ncbi:sodium:solute symporter family protein [Nannocystaceae bacterium ST9]